MTGLCGQFPYWPLEETLQLPFDNKIKPVVAQKVKNLPIMQETQVQSLGGEDALEKGMATHFSFLAWRIPRTKEPGRLQSMRSKRDGHERLST